VALFIEKVIKQFNYVIAIKN